MVGFNYVEIQSHEERKPIFCGSFSTGSALANYMPLHRIIYRFSIELGAVHIQRKGRRNHQLSECQQRRNHYIAKVRARVEHVFGAMEQMGGKCIRTIGQARAVFALITMAVAYNNRRLVFLEVGLSEAYHAYNTPNDGEIAVNNHIRHQNSRKNYLNSDFVRLLSVHCISFKICS